MEGIEGPLSDCSACRANSLYGGNFLGKLGLSPYLPGGQGTETYAPLHQSCPLVAEKCSQERLNLDRHRFLEGSVDCGML